MKKVFVTDAEEGRIPLNVIRSLGRKKINVTVGGEMEFAPPYLSAYCNKRVVYPSVSEKPREFKEFMFNYLKKGRFDVSFPIMNETVLFFSKYKKELSKFTQVPLVNYEKMCLAMDKSNTMKIAKKIKIPHPKTYYPNNIEDIKHIEKELTFPVIVKAKKSFGSRGIKICKTKKEAKEAYKTISAIYGNPIIQEYIPQGGEAIGVSCLFDYQNKAKAVFTHKRLRQYPIDGGPSTLRESIRHEKAEEMALKLLNKLKWFGVAMVEFKIDPRDNKPKLMEINPRFWGSISLPIFAGIDFPYLLYKLVMEGNIERVKKYKIGIKSRWLGGDFLYLMHVKNKLDFLPEYLSFNKKNTYCEDLAKDDPLPFFSRPLSFIYLCKKSIRKKIFRQI